MFWCNKIKSSLAIQVELFAVTLQLIQSISTHTPKIVKLHYIVFVTEMVFAIITQLVENGMRNKSTLEIVILKMFNYYLGPIFTGLYTFAYKDVKGFTVCSPLNGNSN